MIAAQLSTTKTQLIETTHFHSEIRNGREGWGLSSENHFPRISKWRSVQLRTIEEQFIPSGLV